MQDTFSSLSGLYDDDWNPETNKKYRFIENPIVKTKIYKEYALRQNLIRTRLVALAICIIVSKFFYDTFVRNWTYDFVVVLNIYAISILALINVILLFYFKHWCLKHLKFLKFFLILFWLSTIIIDTPTFIRDATVTFQPLNITLWAVGLGVLSVINRKQIVVVFSSFLIFNLAIAFFVKAPTGYIVDISMRIIFIAIIAYVIQYPYNISAVQNLMNSNFDPLTKLLNRRGGMHRLELSIHTNRKMKKFTTLYMLDIDDFKMYNDKYGHQIGDEVLRLVANCINEVFVNEADTKFRYGGEEFLICTSSSETENTNEMQEKLHKAISNAKLSISDDKVCEPVTVSIGYVSVGFEKEETIDSLIQCADMALYEAKRRGKNCSVEFSEGM